MNLLTAVILLISPLVGTPDAVETETDEQSAILAALIEPVEDTDTYPPAPSTTLPDWPDFTFEPPPATIPDRTFGTTVPPQLVVTDMTGPDNTAVGEPVPTVDVGEPPVPTVTLPETR